jgi:shikimate dehydrogenase
MRAAGDPDLKVYGIFGFPLGHTASPAIQNRAFEACGLKSFYFAFERLPDRFRFLMRSLKSLVLDGFNVTIPFKETVIPYLDRLSSDARAIGAVNTAVKKGNRWIGHNTDWLGFLAGLKDTRFEPRGKTAVILGAGGSARAAAYALAKSGVRKIAIVNRTSKRARNLVRKFRKQFPKTEWEMITPSPFPSPPKRGGVEREWVNDVLHQADLLINATSVGLNSIDQPLVPKNCFPKKRILVYDLIYRPRETRLLKLARALGHKTLNGETMLLYQGAEAFRLWTGQGAPIREMKKALRAALDTR